MLTKEEVKNLTMLNLSCNLPAMELRTTALELYNKLEKAEAELAEMKESHALQIDAVIKCKKELAKLKRLVEGKDERR